MTPAPRTARTALILAALLPALAACGQAEEAARNAYRQTAVQACVDQAGRFLGSLPQVDLPSFCGCAVDRFMAGKSLADLRTPPGPSDFNPADLAQCAGQTVAPALPKDAA
jgi:hypothetical protein